MLTSQANIENHLIDTKDNTNTNANNNESCCSIQESQIERFYQDKCILVTGATGFIGKVLIEKLLRSCHGLKRVYLLLRASHGKSAQERLDDMLAHKPFDFNLTKDFTHEKLVAIQCDLSKRNLAIDEADLRILKENVNIVFHVAASVKFDASLDYNMKHNVTATKELLEVTCHFEQLESFVHVSTAYSNCHLRHIDEAVYKMDLKHHLTLMEKKGLINSGTSSQHHHHHHQRKRAQTIYSALLENRPNTYTYTKALAENVVNQYSSRINIAIARPSIVMSSLKEPSVGWVDTVNGPVGLSIMGALGVLQSIDVNSEVVFDLIPVDIVANSLINIAWCIAEHGNRFKSRVFNLTTGTENPCSFYELGRDEAHEKPSLRVTRPLLTIPKQRSANPLNHWIHKLITHLLFAYLLDFCLGLLGKKATMVKMVRKVHHATKIFTYFCSNQWTFSNDNTVKLRRLMNDTDSQIFNCNVNTIDWHSYARSTWLGCRRYILKEDDSTIEEARRKYVAVCCAYWLTKVLLATLVVVSVSPHIYLSSLVLLPCYSVLFLL